MDAEQLRPIVARLRTLGRKLRSDGPQTDDELHAWIRSNLGVNVPRVSVCPDHDPPFKLIADCYFERLHVVIDGVKISVAGALALANRGGSKTHNVAILHFLNATFKPGCGCLQFGATEAQGGRCYENIEEWCYEHDKATGRRTEEVQDFIDGKPMKSETAWKTGSKVEVVAGSEKAVSGPHPCHPGDELVLTFDGYKRIDELRPGVDRLASYQRGSKSSGERLTWGTIHGKILKGSSSRHPGVSWSERRQRWIAQVQAANGRKTLGAFTTEEKAVEAVQDHWRDFPKTAFPFEVGEREYEGNIIVFNSDNSSTRVTPNHVVRASLHESFAEKWVVYLMRRGDWWRIGKTTGARFIYRINEERADCAWILNVFGDEATALEHEAVMSASYGVTTACFQPSKQNGRKIDVQYIHDELSDCSTDRALELLGFFDMHPDLPLYRRTSGTSGVSRSFFNSKRGWFDTAAANLVPLGGCVNVPVAPEEFVDDGIVSKPDKELVDITVEEGYSGTVYSLDIKPYHYYVAGGQVVHNCKAGADEVDQMERAVWDQSRGMAVARAATGPLPEFMNRFDGIIPPQDIVTSTRNSRHGLMQELLDEVAEDLKNGTVPSFVVFIWCIWETVAEVPNCRRAPKDQREARLKELGRDCGELCYCNKVVKGRNKDGSIRTLEQTCDGKAFRSRGWKPYVDLVSTYKRNTPGTWTLQHECREGKDENNYIQDWSLEFYGIHGYEPKPQYGPIYNGIDWGGTNPYCVLWFQYLHTDALALDFNYNEIYLNRGIYVIFKEIYIAGIDTGKLAMLVKNREDAYRAQYGPRWKVKARFADPQGVGDKKLFARKGMHCIWPYISRDKENMISTVQNVVIDDRIAVDVDNCENFTEEIEQWQKDPKKLNKEGIPQEIDRANHAMAAWRYGTVNAEVLEGKLMPRGAPSKLPDDGKRTPTGRKIRNGVRSVVEGSPYSTNPVTSTSRVTRTGPVAIVGGGRHPTDQFTP